MVNSRISQRRKKFSNFVSNLKKIKCVWRKPQIPRTDQNLTPLFSQHLKCQLSLTHKKSSQFLLKIEESVNCRFYDRLRGFPNEFVREVSL